MNQFKSNIGFALVCILFGALMLIGINSACHPSSSGPPDHSEFVYAAPHSIDYDFIYNDKEIDQSFSNEGLITYTVDKDVYSSGTDDMVLKPRSLLHNVQYTSGDIPNPADIIDGIKNAKTFTDLLGYQSAILSLIILIGGWFSKYIPYLNKIDSGTYRIFVFVLVLAIGSVTFGLANVWQVAISYFFSTSLYELVFKKLKEEPTTENTTTK